MLTGKLILLLEQGHSKQLSGYWFQPCKPGTSLLQKGRSVKLLAWHGKLKNPHFKWKYL